MLIKTIKHLLWGLTLCCCQLTLTAQTKNTYFKSNRTIDSLSSLLKKANEDTNKVKLLNKIANEYFQTNRFSDGLNYGKKSFELAQRLNFKKGMIVSCSIIGGIYHGQNDYPNALDYFLKILTVAEELNNKGMMMAYLDNVGIIYDEQGDYPKALDYYLKSLKIAEELGDKKQITICFGNIGIVSAEQHNYPMALDNYFKALKIAEEIKDKKSMGIDFGNIGLAYQKQEEKNFQKSIDYYFKALNIAEELGDQNLIATWLANIGSNYSETKKYAEAEKYLLKALKIIKEIGNPDTERQVEELLSKLYTRTNRFQLSLNHYKKAIAIQDTIFSQENKKQLVRKEMNYEFDKKEIAAKAEQDKKDAVTLEEKQKQKLIIYSISIGLVLFILLALFIFNGYKQKQKDNVIITQQKVEVEKQKELVEEKNKEITDSINYAKRIQQAKLPKKEDIYTALPQSFVLFKPKDIVSGDFYFFHQNAQHIFIAATDCTGHGVPGAFMSMIGSEILEDAVSQTNNTSEILTLLNNGVKASLHQSETNQSTRDGMDIALCSIETESRSVKYTGANRPVWIIRKGNTEIEEIKATKKAIGGFTENNQLFDTHEIKLQEGDTFYIFTDGYADQFGGRDRKKLMTKKFKEILIDIQNKTMQEQEKYLDTFVENWKAGIEQVDDILVIGVRM